MNPQPEILELVELSRAAGGDLLLVQGPGGNSSVKSADGSRMWIKASGIRLSGVGLDSGFVETRLADLRRLLADSGPERGSAQEAQAGFVRGLRAATATEGAARPSMEVGFHATLGRVVLHTHPVYLNAFSCMQGGESAFREALPGTDAAWVAYRPPGYAIAAEVDRECRRHRERRGALPSSLVLANHGFIASGDDAAGILALTRTASDAGMRFFGRLPAESLDASGAHPTLAAWSSALAEALGRRWPEARLRVRPSRFTALSRVSQRPEALLAAGPLMPDDVVYCGPRLWAAEPDARPAAWLEGNWPQAPAQAAVVLAGLGMALVGPGDGFLDAMEENLLAHVLVRELIGRRGAPQPLDRSEVEFISEMESEKFRRQVAAADASPGAVLR